MPFPHYPQIAVPQAVEEKPGQAWRIYDAGADAVTLGNHTFGKMQIRDMLEETPWLLRPANYTGRAPGHGCEI